MDFRWQEQESLEQRSWTPNSDKQLLGKRWAPALPRPTSTWRQAWGLPFQTGPFLIPCSPTLPLQAKSVVGPGTTPDHICVQSMTHRGHSALVSPQHLHPSLAHARSEWLCTSGTVCALPPPPSRNHGHSLACGAQWWRLSQPVSGYLT